MFKTRSQFISRAFRRLRPFTRARVNWGFIENDPLWLAALENSKNGKRVLIATSTGSNWMCSSFESVIAVALTLRGANVRILLCDGSLPACQECDIQWLPEKDFAENGCAAICSSCYKPAHKMLSYLGIKTINFSEFIKTDLSPIEDDDFDAEVKSGVLRYYGRGTYPDSNHVGKIHEKYKKAAKITSTVINGVIKEFNPDVAFFHHGIYVPQGIIASVLKKNSCHFVNWNMSYRNSTVIASHNDSYHYTMPDEKVSSWAGIEWTDDKVNLITEYLKSRESGKNDWITYVKKPDTADALNEWDKLGLKQGKPIYGLFTNVIWDAQLHFKNVAYPTMLDWLFETIQFFISKPDLQLVIRVHPAEIYGTVKSAQPVMAEIKKKFMNLPDNIKVINADSSISTYDLFSYLNAGLIYGTKTGIELSCLGIPVIVAGDAWCRGKGFTHDAVSPQSYVGMLNNLPSLNHLSDAQIMAAKKYAYHLFFRRMLPLKFLKKSNFFSPYRISIKNIEQLMPGYDKGLDLLCDGILKGVPFVLK